MKASPMDISYLLNTDFDHNSTVTPRPESPTKIQTTFNSNVHRDSKHLHYASRTEELAVKAAQSGTLSPQALHDAVRSATESARMGGGAQNKPSTPSSWKSASSIQNPFSVGKRRSRKCSQVYRLNKQSGKLERREDMDALINIAADTYEPSGKARRFLCHCGKWYNKREHLTRHVQLIHLGHRPFHCESCNVSFGTKQNIEVHYRTKKHKTVAGK